MMSRLIAYINKSLSDIHKKGFFHLLSANFLISFLGFGAQLFVAKYLTSVDMGRIKTMQSFISVAVVVAGFGLNTAVLKLCSENRSLVEKKHILKENLRLTFICTVIILVIMGALAVSGYLSPDATINHWILLFIFSIPASVLTSLLICYLQALKKIQLISYAQVAIRLLGVLSLVIFTYCWKLSGFIISTVLVGLIAIIPLLRLIDLNWGDKYDGRDIVRQSLYYGKWSVASNGLGVFGASVDIFLLNYLIKDRAILGDYGLATIFILAMNQITGTVQAIVTPFFSEKSSNRSEFMRVLGKYQRLLIFVAAIITIAAIILVPPFIKLIYKAKYPLSGMFFQILCLRYFFWSCYALLGVALIGLGRMKDNFLASSVYVPIAIILSFVFIKTWGPIGAACAQVAAGFCSLVVVYINCKLVLRSYFSVRQKND